MHHTARKNLEGIVFDLGNVIGFFNHRFFLEDAFGNFHRIPETILKDYQIALTELELGKTPDKVFVSKINELSGKNYSHSQVQEFLGDKVYKYNHNLINLLPKLKAKYKIGVLSDVSEMEFNSAFRSKQFFPIFDAISTSFETGYYKPDPNTYKDILKKLELDPNKSLFIDDKLENIQGALDIGMNALQYNDEVLDFIRLELL